MAIPDGGPLSSVGRKRGFSNMKRTTGPDYMDEIFKISVEHGYRHYFYGASEDTLKKLRIKLESRYPDISIVGSYSPPYRDLTDQEDEEAIKKINEAAADFIWVGLGAPKQEVWMARHQYKVN